MHSNECRIVNIPQEVKILSLIFLQNSVIGIAVFSLSQNTCWELEVWVLDPLLHDGEPFFLRLERLLHMWTINSKLGYLVLSVVREPLQGLAPPCGTRTFVSKVKIHIAILPWL
jgi:hypothetical protein